MASPYVFAVAGVCLVLSGCDGDVTPVTSTSPTAIAAPVREGLATQAIALNEVVEMVLDGTVSSGGWYCEIGNDPMPCERFVLDVPRSGTVVVRLEFVGNEPMFIQIGDLAVGPHLSLATGGSPLVARAVVPAGALPFRVGLSAAWGRNGYVVRSRVVATLE